MVGMSGIRVEGMVRAIRSRVRTIASRNLQDGQVDYLLCGYINQGITSTALQICKEVLAVVNIKEQG